MQPDFNLGDTKLIVSTCIQQGLLRNQAAYVLATAYWETARTMEPVEEAFWVKDADAWRARNLRYYPWHGRGYVQLTWERNYVRAGHELGLDLTSDPSRVMEPGTAAQILVLGMTQGWFTGQKLSDYITREASNYRGARRVVNGTDKAAAIAELAREYEAALLAEGYGLEPAPPIIEDRRDGSRPRTKATESTTLRAVIRDWMGTLGLTGGSVAAWWAGQDADTQRAVYIAVAIIAASLIVSGHAKLHIWRERARKLLTGEDV